MDKQNNQGSQGAREATLQAQDFKNLVKNAGKAKIGDREFSLNTPSANDQNLQSIVNDPSFSARAVGEATPDGKRTYELNGNGKTLKVTINAHSR